MTGVGDLQRAMRRALVDRCVAVDAGLPSADALSIHRNNMLHVLTRALALSFPATERMVGAEFFEAMASAFAGAALPTSAWLDSYGAGFPEFVAGFPPARTLSYLADLAQLEWALAAAATAAPSRALDAAAFAHVPAEDAAGLRFVPHPSLRLVESAFPVGVIHRAALSADEAALAALDLSSPAWLLIRRHRGDGDVEVVALDAPAMHLTRLLIAGQSLGEALAMVPQAADGRTLALHIAGGSFIDVRGTSSERDNVA